MECVAGGVPTRQPSSNNLSSTTTAGVLAAQISQSRWLTTSAELAQSVPGMEPGTCAHNRNAARSTRQSPRSSKSRTIGVPTRRSVTTSTEPPWRGTCSYSCAETGHHMACRASADSVRGTLRRRNLASTSCMKTHARGSVVQRSFRRAHPRALQVHQARSLFPYTPL